MPEMGESVTEGTVLEWHVAEGEAVEEGQTVVEVSTDKVDAEVPAPAAGTIDKILAQPDETVNVGAVLAEMTAGRRRRRRTPREAAGRNRRGGSRPRDADGMATPKPPLSPAGSQPPTASTWARSRDAAPAAR